MSLPTDSKERKTYPMYEGLLKYFPDALAAVARLSYEGNEKHNPGQPLHWAKEKSTDHADCILRHLVDAMKAETITGELAELRAVAWRALALYQATYEAAGLDRKGKVNQGVQNDPYGRLKSIAKKQGPEEWDMPTEGYDLHPGLAITRDDLKEVQNRIKAEDAKEWAVLGVSPYGPLEDME